jgi:hypothetical protein
MSFSPFQPFRPFAASRRRVLDPLTLSPALWLDAADSNTLYDATSGGSLVAADGLVARWEDKSGNARHATQATSTERPTRRVAVQNGKDVVRWASGRFDRMLTSYSYIQAEIEIWVVWNKTGRNTNIFNNTNAIIGGTTTEAGAASRWALTTNENEVRNAQFRNSTSAVSNTFATSIALPSGSEILRLRGSFSNNTVGGARNNAAVSTTAITQGTSFAAGNFMIGGAIGTSSNFSVVGDFMEIFMFGRLLDSTEAQRMANYILTKWATP